MDRWMAAMSHRLTGADYPRAALDAIWQEVLLYQFDILPGSSIGACDGVPAALCRALLAGDRGIGIARLGATGPGRRSTPQPPGSRSSSTRSVGKREQWKLGDAWHNVKAPSLGYAVLGAALPPTSSAAGRHDRADRE